MNSFSVASGEDDFEFQYLCNNCADSYEANYEKRRGEYDECRNDGEDSCTS